MTRTLPVVALLSLAAVGLAQPITQTVELNASDAMMDDSLGFSVAIDGDTLVASAHTDDDNGDRSGVAFVFERVNGVWNEVAKLLAPDGLPGDEFSYAVAIEGDLAVIGARIGDSAALADTGAVYVFRRDAGGAGAWGFVQKLTPAAPLDGQRFGVDVAIDGDTIAIASMGYDLPGNGAGAAYVFERADDTSPFVEAQRLAAADTTLGDNFGRTVELDGDLLAIGATRDDELAPDAGAGYIFERSGDGTWVERDKVLASDGANGHRFGYACAIEGTTVIFTARRTTLNGVDSGTVYIYEETAPGSRDWEESALLVAPDAMGDLYFGEEVQLDNGNLLIGASHIDTRTGAAYAFRRDASAPNGWAFRQRINASNPTVTDFFGVGVDLSGDTAVIGAFQADSACPGEPQSCDAGAAYVFDGLDASAPCPGDCDGSETVDFNDLVAMLFEFGTPSPAAGCDCDDTSAVDFNDLVCALFVFGPCP